MDQIEPGAPGVVDPNQPPPAPGNGAEPPSAEDAATEAFARRLGWRPESEFAGAPPSKRPKSFLSATDYIAKVETEVPILRDRLRRQDGTLVEAARRLEESATVIKQMHESQKTLSDRAYKRAREDLEREMDAAANVGDPAGYEQAKRKIKVLDEDHQVVSAPAKPTNGAAAPDQPQQPAKIPEVETWADKNPWFRNSVVLNQAAIEHEATLDRSTSLAERLEQTSEWVRDNFAHTYPQHFPGYQPRAAEPPAEPRVEPPTPPTNPRRAVPGAVAQPSGGGVPPAAGLTYESLTADERTHCDYLCRTVRNFTKDDFLRDYKR